MNRKLYSGSSLAIIAVLLLAVISVSQILFRGWRVDLTENDLYTLSDGTKNVLAKIEEPIQLYFFYNREAAAEVPHIQTYARRVREFLEELVLEADGKLRLTTIDPEPFSDDEDRAVELGVQSVPLGDGSQNLYLGLAMTNAVDDVETIPFFQPSREELLEYEVVKAIYSLSNPVKPKIGVLSTLDINGGFDPQRMQQTPPWTAVAQLREFFEVENLTLETTEIGPDIGLLLLIHPAGLPDELKYAIDQFVLGGGKALVFVDPFAETAAPRMGPEADGPPPNSSLEPLFAAWGLKLSGDVLGDADAALPVQMRQDQRPVYHLAMLGLDARNLNDEDVITRGLESVNAGIAGILEPVADAGTRFEPLIQSGPNAAPIPAFRVQPGMNPAVLQSSFAPTGERYTLAARIQGPAKSAYAEPPVENPAHRAESDGEINVIVVADTDMLADRFWVRVANFLGQTIATPFAGNGDFLVNAADNLLGSSDVISIRSRAGFSRPFTRVDDMRREADAQFRKTEEALQDQLRETERKLSELQAQKSDENVLVLSAEQRAEIEKFQQEKLRVRKQLRDVRHNLNKDIDRLETQLKFINIALVPALVIILALVLGAFRRRSSTEGAL